MGERAVFVGILTLVLTLYQAPSAGAEVEWHPDGDDSASSLDIRQVGVVSRNGHRVTVNIQTFEEIHLGDGQLWAHLDSWGGPRWDYGFHIWYDGGSSGIFCDWRNRRAGPGKNPLIGYSVEGSTARCRFDADEIVINKPVRWRVFSTDVPDESPTRPHPSDIVDRAPNGGCWYPGVVLRR